MIKIHHMPRTRSLRVVWLAEEMGLSYEAVPENLRTPSEVLAANNPGKTIPLMVDGDLVLSESVTMLEYLAETYGPTPLALQPGHPNYWDYRQMLLFGEATLAGPVNALVGTAFWAPDDQKDNFTAKVVRDSFAKRLGVVSQRLAKRPYVAGDNFTIADISVVYPIGLALGLEPLGLKSLVTPDLVDYQARLSERPAYQRAIAVP